MAQVAKLATVPSPTGGLNSYNSLVSMPETDAIALVNLVPQVYGLYLRKGFRKHAENLPDKVETLATYARSDGNTSLFAFSDGGMYDVTASGDTYSAEVSGLTSAVWQYVSFANSAGTHFVAFNGIDDGIWVHNEPMDFDRLTAGNGTDPGTWSNVDPAHLIQPIVHQRRIWAVEVNTTYGWYLPPDQVYGVASKFDFGPLFKRGGYLQLLSTWTVDDGDGSDDMLVAVSSEGEVAIYKGIDPSSADSWALTGVYYMGEPVSGRRFATKVGGDVKFMTTQGLVSLNDMLTSTKTSPAQNTIEATKVQQTLAALGVQWKYANGWQLYFCPQQNMLFINIPTLTSQHTQFVENTVNSAWCEFSGYKALCFETFNQSPFFGGPDGTVYEGWFGHCDNVELGQTDGDEVIGRVQQAYSYMGAPVVNKQVGMYRPNFLVSAKVDYGSQIAYDFSFATPAFGFAVPGGDEARWDDAIWDSAIWAGGLKPQKYWEQGQGMGVASSLCMVVRSKVETIWVSTDYTFKVGGPL